MPFVLTSGTSALCAHGGSVTFAPAQTRVVVSGQPAATLLDVDTVAGCPFVTGGNPMPCVSVQWITGATRVTISGSPALLQSSTATCIPNGTPVNILVTQTQVMAE